MNTIIFSEMYSSILLHIDSIIIINSISQSSVNKNKIKVCKCIRNFDVKKWYYIYEFSFEDNKGSTSNGIFINILLYITI